MWTVFMDMASGGYKKTEYDYILVEAGEELAVKFMTEILNLPPNHVTCNCCGRDFSIREYYSLEDAKKYTLKSNSVRTYSGDIVNAEKVSDGEYSEDELEGW